VVVFRIWSCFGAIAMVGFIHTSAIAETCVRPEGFPEDLPCPMQPWESVVQEHEDRIARLKRLSSGWLNFEFSTTILAAEEHGLEGFPVDLPVLRVIADADTFFDTDSVVVRPEALSVIYIIAESLMREPPDVSLFVAGHTDSRASEAYNMDLGTARAEAVAAALVRRGVYQASIYRVSFGEYMPIADNDTRGGQARNRRVEFLFSARSEAIVDFLEKQEVKLCADHIDASPGSCRQEITIAPRRVQLNPTETRSVIQTQARRSEILSDKSLTQVEVANELQSIEVETNRREVQILETRIEIQLGDE
jgi:OmpA-OmpF porin, OOP family